MRYLITINDDELRGNGDFFDFEKVKDDVQELLRSGYYQVESFSVDLTEVVEQ